MGTERDDVERRIIEANARIQAYNSALVGFPECFLSYAFEPMAYVKYHGLRPREQKHQPKHPKRPAQKHKLQHGQPQHKRR